MTTPAFPTPFHSLPDSEVVLQIRIRRSSLLGLGLTVLVHIAILVFLLFFHVQKPLTQSTERRVTQVNLLPLAPKPRAEREPVPKPKPSPRAPPRPSSSPPPPEPPPPPPAPSPNPAPVAAEPQVDFLATVNARRRAREQTDAQPAEPSENDKAMANINRNLASLAQKDGTNGTFQLLSRGTRVASFSFRGWTREERNSTREVFEVDAGLGGDVELAVARKMIEIIRRHYQGDFNFDSYRLNRVVVLSARPQDQAGLEAFLIREFFGRR
jgi:outer membrane biosynthesis protein TonB